MAISNIPTSITRRIGRQLHCQKDHPIYLIRRIIERTPEFHPFANVVAPVNAVVPAKKNFDDLLIPVDHVSRGMGDTYYDSYPEKCLRTHTTTHEAENYWRGQFLLFGDVYRRDEIDRSHFPIFHQMEGVCLFERETGRPVRRESEEATEWKEVSAAEKDEKLPTLPAPLKKEDVLANLQDHCEVAMMSLLSHLMMQGTTISKKDAFRWSSDFFPFTNPSLELEVQVGLEGQWLEVLGCGVLEDQVLKTGGVNPEKIWGWAFGFGLERLAMMVFQIPDIRLFWSKDERFLNQFEGLTDDLEAGGDKWKDVRFKEFSKYPSISKDISFWLPQANKALSSLPTSSESAESCTTPDFNDKDFYEILRDDFSSELQEDETIFKADHNSSNPGYVNAEISLNQDGSAQNETMKDFSNIVETVRLIDEFEHPSSRRKSKTFRITYRDMSKTLTHDQINRVQNKVTQKVQQKLGVTIR